MSSLPERSFKHATRRPLGLVSARKGYSNPPPVISAGALAMVSAGPNREVQGVTELIVALPAPGFLQALSVLEQIRDQL